MKKIIIYSTFLVLNAFIIIGTSGCNSKPKEISDLDLILVSLKKYQNQTNLNKNDSLKLIQINNFLSTYIGKRISPSSIIPDIGSGLNASGQPSTNKDEIEACIKDFEKKNQGQGKAVYTKTITFEKSQLKPWIDANDQSEYYSVKFAIYSDDLRNVLSAQNLPGSNATNLSHVIKGKNSCFLDYTDSQGKHMGDSYFNLGTLDPTP